MTLAWELDDNPVSGVFELSDKLSGHFENVKSVKMISFDRTVEKYAERPLPKSADAFYCTDSEAVFVEFKKWPINISDKDCSELKLENLRCSIHLKASDSLCLFPLIADANELIAGKKKVFILVDDEPESDISATINRLASGNGKYVMKKLGFIGKYNKKDTDGKKIFYDEVRRFGPRDFAAYLMKENILFPKQD